MKKQQSGFTLVEIAIVMVIIGLLLGGVLKGQEVITNAKIKNINNDFSGISAAVYSYQDRYSTLPGDDAVPAAHVTGGILADDSAGTVGDGLIDGNFEDAGTAAAAVTDTESALAWQHLRAAGLITGVVTSSLQPQHAFGGLVGIQSGDNAADAAVNGITSLLIGFQGVPQEMAAILDAQNDDGEEDTGSIRSSSNGDGNYIDLAAPLDLVFQL